MDFRQALKLSFKFATYALTLSILTIGFNNCGTGFSPESFDELASSSTTIADVVPTEPQADEVAAGKALYANQCANCHGSIADTAKRGRTVAQINSAIASISTMSSLKPTAVEVRLIALALEGTAATPAPTPRPTTSDSLNCSSTDVSVGHVAIHRLNNRELSNTLRDLFGFQTAVALRSLPENGDAEFDNNAAVLYTNEDYVESLLTNLSVVLGDVFSSSTLKKKFVTCLDETEACAKTIVTRFAAQAFRRPATAVEVSKLTNVYSSAKAAGLTHELSLQSMMKAALVSPHFLFRTIDHSKPNDPSAASTLSSYELASRLSYFIWSSMPDDTLLELARTNSLNEATLRTQVKRMLKDRKARSLTDSYARQWMQLGLFDSHESSENLFPAFTSNIRVDMTTESRLLLEDIFVNDLSLNTLLTADYTYVNRRLAKYYGLPVLSTTDTDFKKTPYGASDRAGILGHGSILTATSHVKTTSIVYRGKWVLESLLCDVPPPPPDSVDLIVVGSDQNASNERMTNRACAGCHAPMDPIGIGMQRFDAVGHYRTVDEEGRALELSGKLPDGTRFSGIPELASVLKQDRRFAFCSAQKMLSYALGRQMLAAEKCRITKLGLENLKSDKPVSELITSIILSDFFRKQTGE